MKSRLAFSFCARAAAHPIKRSSFRLRRLSEPKAFDAFWPPASQPRRVRRTVSVVAGAEPEQNLTAPARDRFFDADSPVPDRRCSFSRCPTGRKSHGDRAGCGLGPAGAAGLASGAVVPGFPPRSERPCRSAYCRPPQPGRIDLRRAPRQLSIILRFPTERAAISAKSPNLGR